MGNRISGLMSSLYDSKRRQFLGRDGAGWGKLGIFYFFFYLGLAGFFCSMLAIFMALSPRDRPRYFSETSRMSTRTNPISPGLGFRPQPEIDKNLIVVNKNSKPNESNPYVDNLNQYLQVYYWQHDEVEKREGDEFYEGDVEKRRPDVKKFSIKYPGDCTNNTKYGFSTGKPCVLVKMNKIVGFKPRPGGSSQDKSAYQLSCQQKPNAIAVQCFGEYPADVDNIGTLSYISENGWDNKCGSLETKWFPYEGKYDRKDYYQAPYIWVQFNNPKPNVLINVLCRVFGQNIEFDKKTGRALTRFQIFVNALPESASKRRGAEF